METSLVKSCGMENALQSITPTQLLEQVSLIQNVMASVMKDGEHYGLVPGCGKKPTLLKAGAEKLAFVFRLAPEFDGMDRPIDLGNGHREYIIRTTLRHVESGKIWGQGVGSCSTMEKKYRYRSGPSDNTGKSVPHEYWDLRKSDPQKAQEIIGGKGYTTKKDDGQWFIFQQGESIENDCIADVYNTVLKMAKKRSIVDATLTATAASDIFTQDIEDLTDKLPIETTAIISTPAQPAAAHPAPDKPQPAPQKMPTDLNFGIVEKVEIINGTYPKTKKPWTRYGVTIHGETFGTFDKKIGERAMELQGSSVTFVFNDDGKYKTLESIAAMGQPAEREPGQDEYEPSLTPEQQNFVDKL